jgi:hypothetical protein
MSDESGRSEKTRVKVVALVIAVIFVLAAGATISFYFPKSPATRSTTAVSSSTTSSNYVYSNSLSGLPYFNASAVYASLGFPQISYFSSENFIPYATSEPNFTLQVKLGTEDYYPGYANILAPVIGLKESVSLGAAAAKLNPANYTLAAAIFYPGLGSSAGPLSDPEWHLYFEQIYAGYWVLDYNVGGWPIEADVDALNGTVAVRGAPLSNLPEPGRYDLNVSSSSALKTIRALNLTDDPALTKNGVVSSMAPMIVFPGISPLTQWVNASLAGESRLVWIIGLDNETLCCSHTGTFAVDAQTGQLLGDTQLDGIGFPMIGYVTTSFVFSTARNMSVSQQTYPLNASAIGRPGSVLAAFPNILTVKPGSTASIQLNVSAGSMQNPPAISFSFSSAFRDPVQNLSSSGAPPGVSFQFSNPSLVLSKGPANTTLLISIGEDAPSGTYFILLQPLQSPASQIVGGNVVFFFLSVWDGVGQWPPPPITS